MVPTLLEGDRILVCRICVRLDDVDRGDVIVFEGPDNVAPERGIRRRRAALAGRDPRRGEPAARGLRQAGRRAARRHDRDRSHRRALRERVDGRRAVPQPAGSRHGFPTDDACPMACCSCWATTGGTRGLPLRPAELHGARAGGQGDRGDVREGLAAVEDGGVVRVAESRWTGTSGCSRAQGFTRVAGADEAGRGALAGPLVAAAVILPDGFDIDGINDSKVLSERAARGRVRAHRARPRRGSRARPSRRRSTLGACIAPTSPCSGAPRRRSSPTTCSPTGSRCRASRARRSA